MLAPTPGFLKELEQAEGYRSQAYDDATGKTVDFSKISQGFVTIGIGCNIHNGISRALALHILEFQVNEIIEQLAFRFQWFDKITRARREAMIEIAFNCGLTEFLLFKKMIAAMGKGLYQTAARECLDSSAARQLPARYSRIAEKIRNG